LRAVDDRGEGARRSHPMLVPAHGARVVLERRG
jgi:hypothetical protein